jgi:hypothetical protein
MGFIIYETKGQQREAFFSQRCVEGDWKGSRTWTRRNVQVMFELEPGAIECSARRGVSPAPRATNVRRKFPEDPQEHLETYREASKIMKYDPQTGVGFLIRPCGDTIVFHDSHIVDRTLLHQIRIKPGDFVYHAVRRLDRGWEAALIELYSPEEQEEIQFHFSVPEEER